MKQKYNIGELEFKTKKDCENYTRNIINNLGCCIINKDHIQYNFFNNLIKNHPEYYENRFKFIDYFYININPLSKKFMVNIKKLDKSSSDFSWIYCCKFKKRDDNFYLTREMRKVISPDIVNFKKNQNKLICNFCGNDNELYENFHIDHHKPSFKNLKENFLKITDKQIPTIFNDVKIYDKNIDGFKYDDEEFKNEWVEYHNKNCNLQVLCKSCNLKKPKD